jgi:nicotinamide mononucleotide (NMN) deamidase PncC
MNETLKAQAEDLVASAKRAKLTIITAESCTSGLLATVLSPGLSRTTTATRSGACSSPRPGAAGR